MRIRSKAECMSPMWRSTVWSIRPCRIWGGNPSVGGGPRHLETHIFDFSGDLYGRRLRVELRRKIRDERKFDSLEELQRQIERDRSCILSSENRRR